jgi:hypothetical protein
VKLKNLKANHNFTAKLLFPARLLFTREIKELESKSQLQEYELKRNVRCNSSVKIKNLKANDNL